MAEEKKAWNGINVTIPNKLHGKKSYHHFPTKEGKDMVAITLPPHLELTDVEGNVFDASYTTMIVNAKNVKQWENDPAYISVGIPLESKDGKPWEVNLKREVGHWEHPDQEGKARGEWITDSRETIKVTPEAFRSGMQEFRTARQEWTKAHPDRPAQEQPEEDKKPEKEDKPKQSPSLREEGKASKAAAAKLKEDTKAKDEQSMDLPTVDHGVAI